MSERFYIRPDGKYYAIYWGPTLICTAWTDEAGAQAQCDILECLRHLDTPMHPGETAAPDFALLVAAWRRFRDHRMAGR